MRWDVLVWDTLADHLSTRTHYVSWLQQYVVLPVYTPLSGGWLTRAESVRRILVCRALCGQHPQTPDQLITWLEQSVAGWNAAPTPLQRNGPESPRLVSGG